MMISEYPNIVIRPSGIWNSRAPFHDFLFHHRVRSRTYFATVLALSKVRLEAHTSDPSVPAKSFFLAKIKGRRIGAIAERAWLRYRRAVPPPAKGEKSTPTVQDAGKDVTAAFQGITEYFLIGHSALFETFVQCWALNYLLAALEGGRTLTSAERKLARALSPLRKHGNIPSVPHIVKTFPVLTGLSELPHIHIDASSDTEVTTPLSARLNAFETIMFWRAYRNLVVHSSGVVSAAFHARHSPFYSELVQSLPSIEPIQVGKKLQHTEATAMTVASTHYHAALWMNRQLEAASGGRRGHLFAPAAKRADTWVPWPPPHAPFLLLDGDHGDSVRFTEDEEFRAGLLAKFGSGSILEDGHSPTA